MRRRKSASENLHLYLIFTMLKSSDTWNEVITSKRSGINLVIFLPSSHFFSLPFFLLIFSISFSALVSFLLSLSLSFPISLTLITSHSLSCILSHSFSFSLITSPSLSSFLSLFSITHSLYPSLCFYSSLPLSLSFLSSSLSLTWPTTSNPADPEPSNGAGDISQFHYAKF